MRRDYRLYELDENEFEALVVRICIRWLGQGVTPFAPGRDKGRDGKFHGTANCFPSDANCLSGHFVLQAKHVSAPDRSCSDRDFAKLLKDEEPKIKRLVGLGICDHYIVFTNRKLTAGSDERLIESLLALGLKSAHIIGVERLSMALDDFAEIRNTLPNQNDPIPFRFNLNDLIDVIVAIHEYSDDVQPTLHKSALDFARPKIPTKNTINGLSVEYYCQIIVNNSMPHFDRVHQFLTNPRNRNFAELYHDSADELKQKILVKRNEFASFDEVFIFLIEEIQTRQEALRGKRRLISILLHYMYFDCEIGSKDLGTSNGASVHANA
jgi:hypothetical protein